MNTETVETTLSELRREAIRALLIAATHEAHGVIDTTGGARLPEIAAALSALHYRGDME